MKDLTDYKLVFFDDFDKGTLDTDMWAVRGVGPRRCGFNSEKQISFDDTCIHFKGEYKEGEYGAGWYGGMVNLKCRWTKGYYECKCRPSHALPGGLWSAYWFQAEHPYDKNLSHGGRDGAEIDIFECYTGTDGVEYFESTIHCAGMEKSLAPSRDLDSLTFIRAVPENLCSDFHIFGLDWDDENYTIYLDGVKLASTGWGDGTSSAPGELILSLELPANENFTDDKSYTCDYAVDWLKIWKKE